MKASTYQWRMWHRRAETLRRNAAALLDDMSGVLGVEDKATDFADNVSLEADTLCDVLKRCGDAAKAGKVLT